MAATREILDAYVQRLRSRMPGYAGELFPEAPSQYRLNHPAGAFLIAYAGSQFQAPADTEFVAQPRDLRVTVTLVFRQLHGRDGAIDALDQARRHLLGFRPPDCRKTRAVGEKFIGQVEGQWQYALDLATQTVAIEDAIPDVGPLLVRTHYEETP
ncbi:Gp37 family protein [Lysobacter sp. CA199]|uniref:Gp37 family protein n=1 Tax=Lysobacter sp. CA199 TaxID=3455608 RepID=UPI003F8D172E